MKVRALMLVFLLLLAIVPAMEPALADTGETRSPGDVNVKLYAHIGAQSATLDTAQSSSGFRPTNALEFESIELEGNLEVQGVDAGVGQNKGLEVRIGVQSTLQASDATVSVLDDGTVIAEKDMSIPAGETRWDWELPFLNDIDSYTFLKRHVITLRVEADRNVVIKTDSDSYVGLLARDHLSITVETRDVDDRKATNFFPNDLAEFRHVFIEGDIIDPFGASDVDGVNISIRRPDGQYVIEDEAATVGADLNYTYDWNYATGLPSGLYNVNVTGRDLQGNEFSTIGSFMMAEYGIRMFAEGEEGGVISGSTTPGSPAKYTLTILNIGGKRADVVMNDGDPVPLWQTSFSKSSFSLDPGDDTDITYDVKPSSTLGGGNSTVYVVTATISNDPNTPKAKDTISVETYVRNEVDLKVDPENPDPKTVGVGGSVDHVFTVRNVGEFTTTVDLTKTGVPVAAGWKAGFEGNRVVDDSIEDLRPMEIVDVILKVTAPDSSDVKRATINIRFQSLDYPDVYEDRTTVTNMVIGLVLKPTTPTNVTKDPGESFVLIFDAMNNDPTSDHEVDFSVIQDSTNWPSTSFKFTPISPVTISADSKEQMILEVVVPTTAEAGTHKFTVKGMVDDRNEVYATFDFNVKINVQHEIAVELDPQTDEIKIDTKEESIVYLTITNNGNVVEMVNVTVDVATSDVEVRMNGAITTIMLNIRVEPEDSEQIKISFRAKDTARHNQVIPVSIIVEMASDATPIRPGDFNLLVVKSSSELFFDYMDWAAIILIMLFMMVALLVFNPRKRRDPKEPEGEKKEKSTTGTMARH